MDYRVWAAMTLVCFFSLGLYGYSRIRLHYTKVSGCISNTILVDNKRIDDMPLCDLNRLTLFKLQAPVTTANWYFGDGTSMIKGQLVQHTYAKPGRYRVVAILDGTCRYEGTVAVRNLFDPIANKKFVPSIFADPAKPKVGQPVIVTSVTGESARSYEWKVSGSDAVQRDSIATFTFDTPATYTVQLILNNDISTRAEIKIKVAADEPPPPDIINNGSVAGAVPNVNSFSVPPVTPGANPFDKQNTQPPTPNQAVVLPGTNKQDSVKKIHPTAIDADAFKGLLQAVLEIGRAHV